MGDVVAGPAAQCAGARQRSLSRVAPQLEVTVDTVADWEAFLERVPAQEHRAWSQRIQVRPLLL